MAIVTTLQSITGRVKVRTGYDEESNPIYANISLGNLDESAFTGATRETSLSKLIDVADYLSFVTVGATYGTSIISTESVREEE